MTKFPLSEERIIGEQWKKKFIMQFGATLHIRNLLTCLNGIALNEIFSKISIYCSNIFWVLQFKNTYKNLLN